MSAFSIGPNEPKRRARETELESGAFWLYGLRGSWLRSWTLPFPLLLSFSCFFLRSVSVSRLFLSRFDFAEWVCSLLWIRSSARRCVRSLLSNMAGGCDGWGHRLFDSDLNQNRTDSSHPGGRSDCSARGTLYIGIRAKFRALERFDRVSPHSRKRADFSSVPAFPLPAQSGNSTRARRAFYKDLLFRGGWPLFPRAIWLKFGIVIGRFPLFSRC